MKVKSWKIDLQKNSLREIMGFCVRNFGVDHLLFVIRLEQRSGSWKAMEPNAEKWIRTNLKSFLVEDFLAQAWPGTRLTNTPARVFIANLTDHVQEKILNTQSRLEKWLNNASPSLPEDLCLFRKGDDLPVLLSVTHESDAWLIANSKPPLASVRADFVHRDESFIFPGKFFCLPWRIRK